MSKIGMCGILLHVATIIFHNDNIWTDYQFGTSSRITTKYLKEYPEWQFLSQEELNRKTIEIFFDLKIAKRFCNKEQKVIKIPNTDVFKIAAPILLKKGISRIVSSDKLISL